MKREVVYRGELEDAIRRFLTFGPDHAALADGIAREAATRAAEVESGRVGRTLTLSWEERAGLAARGLIRHRDTSYEEDRADACVEDPWGDGFFDREVRAGAQHAVYEFLEEQLGAPPVT